MRISEIKTYLFLALIILSTGCSPRREIKYVPVENTSARIDTIFLYAERTDSVIDRDSVMIYQAGDTVRIESIKWRVRVKERLDTLRSTTLIRDTVTRIIEIPVKGKDTVGPGITHTLIFKRAITLISLVVIGFLIIRYLKEIRAFVRRFF